MKLNLVVALGIVLAFEGLTYALVPGQMKAMMARMQEMPAERLRILGVMALALGVLLIWLAGGGEALLNSE